jgi:hypothetical protein
VTRLLTRLATCFVVFWCAQPVSAATIPLGSFNFDSALFGNTLVESDGGTFSSQNWLNVTNADPGNPAYLTGANFDTGVANVGLFGSEPLYTIGYSTGIVNGAGADLGIVDATFSNADTYRIAVSTDGVTFSSFQSFSEALAVNTGVTANYFYNSGGPFGAGLGVIPIDLSVFGIAAGSSIVAVQITGSPQADLIRVAGFAEGDAAPVPEPASLTLLGVGLAGMAGRRWRQRKAS